MDEGVVSDGGHPLPSDVTELIYLLPPEVDPVCNAAVDPLEIAAGLETAGISNRVAQTRFGRPDLFTLAEELYNTRTGRNVPLRNQPRPPRPGGVQDLALGLLFVVPAVSLTVAARALHLVLPWWALPLALTVGWAFGQATAGSAIALTNGGGDPAPAVLPGLVLTVATGTVAALLAMRWGHGSWSAVLTITVFCLYVASLTVLSVYKEAAAIALTLAPALLVSAATLADPSNRYLRTADVVAVALTVAASLALALRHARFAWWSPQRLGTHERRSVLTFFSYGACCGVAVSAVTLVARGAQSLGPLSLVALPVMLSLGVLEWQLHTFRARATRALQVAPTLAAFERRAVGDLVRSTACYLTTLLVVSAAVGLLRAATGHQLPLLALGAEDAIGVTLFTGMVVSMCSALHLGVRSWLAGGLTFALAVAAVHVLGLGTDGTALQAASLAGATVAMVSMLAGTLRVVRVPFHYHG
jgi:hypothetical protein